MCQTFCHRLHDINHIRHLRHVTLSLLSHEAHKHTVTSQLLGLARIQGLMTLVFELLCHLQEPITLHVCHALSLYVEQLQEVQIDLGMCCMCTCVGVEL